MHEPLVRATKRASIVILSVALSSCGGGGSEVRSETRPPVSVPPSGTTSPPPPTSSPPPTGGSQTPVADPMMNPANWEIGPIIPGYGNYSVGMPLHPSIHPTGWAIDLPQPSKSVGHVHYVTTPISSLEGKSRVVLRFRIEAAPDVRIVAKDYPDSAGMLTLYFQRAGDNWSALGEYETYRWWATFRTQTPLTAGEYEIVARFDENWTATQTSAAFTNWSAYQAALKHAGRIGFTLGGGDGYGHGVYATGPARIVVTTFRVE